MNFKKMTLKINGAAGEALRQINDRGYARRYDTDPRRIVKAGIGFSVEQRAMTDYIIEEDKPAINLKSSSQS